MRNGRKKLRVICGAKNRRGLPCQCKLLLLGNRCKFHGGMTRNSGPKTPEGKVKVTLNLPSVRKRLANTPDLIL